MDYVLLAICGYFSLKGFFKGFIFMTFSLVGTFFVILVAWNLSASFLPAVQSVMFVPLSNWLQGILTKALPGTFESVEALGQSLSVSPLAVFGLFLLRLLGDISFEGSLTAGQILAPTLANLILKVLTFAILFLILLVFLKALKILLNKFVKTFGLSTANKFLGAFVGLLKGILLFGVLYFVLSSFANLFVSESLLNFVQSGIFSRKIYENVVLKILTLFNR